MKKLLFVTQDLAIGGFTSSLSSLYDKIKNDYDINVLVLANIGNANVSYKDKIILSRPILNLYYQDFTNAKFLSKFKIGLIKLFGKLYNRVSSHSFEEFLAKHEYKSLDHFDCIISYGEGFATTFTQYIGDIPKIAWIHYEVSRLPFSEKMNKLYSKFDRIIVVSQIIAENFKKTQPNLCNKIEYVPNIVDNERVLTQSKAPITEIFNKELFNIISIGRITPIKRFREIPQIARQLKRNRIPFRWRILGPATDEEEKKNLLHNIASLQLQDCVKWLGDISNPYPFLASSNLLVLLSLSEAHPMVITEARALNIPIITTNFSTSREYINNGIDGIICDIDEMTEKITFLYNTPEQYARIKENSQKRGDSNNYAIEKFNHLLNSIK